MKSQAMHAEQGVSMKLAFHVSLSIALIAFNHPLAAQSGQYYFFQHQISIKKTDDGCALSILYPEQGPLSFEYKPKDNITKISYQVPNRDAIMTEGQLVSFVLNASDPSPDATESIPYNDSGMASVNLNDGHTQIDVLAQNGDRLIEFIGRAYSISLDYKLTEGENFEVEIESYYIDGLSEPIKQLKECAKSEKIEAQ